MATRKRTDPKQGQWKWCETEWMDWRGRKAEHHRPPGKHTGVGDEQRCGAEEQSTVTREVEPDTAGQRTPRGGRATGPRGGNAVWTETGLRSPVVRGVKTRIPSGRRRFGRGNPECLAASEAAPHGTAQCHRILRKRSCCTRSDRGLTISWRSRRENRRTVRPIADSRA